MSLPASTAERHCKLLPLLGSDKDGEVLGAARAIRRTLQSAGQDLHDLARRLASERPQRVEPVAPSYSSYSYEPPRQRSGPMRWRGLYMNSNRYLALDGISGLALSAWEKQFLRDMYAKLDAGHAARLSPRQVRILDDLLFRLWKEEQ